VYIDIYDGADTRVVGGRGRRGKEENGKKINQSYANLLLLYPQQPAATNSRKEERSLTVGILSRATPVTRIDRVEFHHDVIEVVKIIAIKKCKLESSLFGRLCPESVAELCCTEGRCIILAIYGNAIH